MRATVVVASLLLHFVALNCWFVLRATPLSLSNPIANGLILLLVAIAAVLNGALGKGAHGISYVSGAFLGSVLFVPILLWVLWGLANPVVGLTSFTSFLGMTLRSEGILLIAIVVLVTATASAGLWFGRKFGASQRNSHASSASQWDFAIAVRPGWHVTLFTSQSFLVWAAILVVIVLAIVLSG
jgi:hypothetical protein